MDCRDKIIDSLKYFLIFLVILGHTLSKITTLYVPKIDDVDLLGGVFMLNSIYSFHMPLFVLLSGYVFHKKSLEKFLISILGLFASLLVFEIIVLVLKLIFFKSTIPIDRPYWTYWYLLSLIYWRAIVEFVPQRILSHRRIVMMFSIFVSVVSGLLPFGHILSIQRTFVFLPFFVAGYYLERGNLQSMRYNCKLVPVLIILVCLAIIYFLSSQYPDLIKMLRGATQFKQMEGNVCSLITLRCVTIALAFGINFSILSLYKITLFSSQGEQSLAYYLYHGILIEFVIIPCCMLLHIDNSLSLILLSFVATIFILVFIHFFMKSRLLYNLTNPLRWYLQKKHIQK